MFVRYITHFIPSPQNIRPFSKINKRSRRLVWMVKEWQSLEERKMGDWLVGRKGCDRWGCTGSSCDVWAFRGDIRWEAKSTVGSYRRTDSSVSSNINFVSLCVKSMKWLTHDNCLLVSQKVGLKGSESGIIIKFKMGLAQSYKPTTNRPSKEDHNNVYPRLTDDEVARLLTCAAPQTAVYLDWVRCID